MQTNLKSVVPVRSTANSLNQFDSNTIPPPNQQQAFSTPNVFNIMLKPGQTKEELASLIRSMSELHIPGRDECQFHEQDVTMEIETSIIDDKMISKARFVPVSSLPAA
jgi:hypothetical protein